MSDQLEIRLSSLHNAGEQLRNSTTIIGDSVAAIGDILHELTALGYQSPSNMGAAQPLYAEAQLRHCLDNLYYLRTQLDQTVDAVEGAMIAHFPPLGALWKPAQARNNAPAPSPSIAVLPIAAFDPSRYVSSVNSPLYEQWRHNRDTLDSQQAHLQTLIATRTVMVEDLRALQNRLSSTLGVDASHVPDVIHLQDQIHQIDDQILNTRGEIGQLEGKLNELTTRLERVAPGAGANLAELHQLEQGESSLGLKTYTEGCVNYIVQRIHIPAVLGRDAYLWNDIATQNPQYGIRAGSTPLVGSVLVMEQSHSYADDLYGHVMYVERVDGSDVWITDNLHPTPVKLSDLTSETSGPNLTYLALPWHTSG